MTLIQKLDLRNARHVYVVGDIHGCFTKLQDKLDKIGFDPQQDVLLSVGDLVDRGPDSDKVLDWLDQPWFYAVKGNHEQMIYSDLTSKERSKNGQKWFNKLYYKDVALYRNIARRLRDLPVAIEATVPGGARIGIIHATVPELNWSRLEYNLETSPNAFGLALWDRDDIGRAERAAAMGGEMMVRGIDHVFYGHTPLDKPFTNGNQSWIDTGACWGDNEFTVVRIDE